MGSSRGARRPRIDAATRERVTAAPNRSGTKGAATQTRLLDSALAVFGREGHAGFTVHAVVAESGVSLGSLYHHFGSFHGLASALYARCMADLLDALIARIEHARTARGGVTAVVEGYLAHAVENPIPMRFIYASSYATYLPEHAATIAAIKGPRLEVLGRFLHNHVEKGRIVVLPEPLYEMLIIGPVSEVCERWLAGDARYDLAIAGKYLPERIWRSIRAPHQTRLSSKPSHGP
ncbi:MAG: TetR/AcrR family transcriptional regulator [Polyangiaceae bacterium]|nr:TetR/AcrR family transcriptional regulator [Polyangiaceae bacterium]